MDPPNVEEPVVSVRRSTGSVRDNIMFFAMARNLKDGPSFRVWIAKLWEFDFGLTVKYMRRHADDFDDESIAYFNCRHQRQGEVRDRAPGEVAGARASVP